MLLLIMVSWRRYWLTDELRARYRKVIVKWRKLWRRTHWKRVMGPSAQYCSETEIKLKQNINKKSFYFSRRTSAPKRFSCFRHAGCQNKKLQFLYGAVYTCIYIYIVLSNVYEHVYFTYTTRQVGADPASFMHHQLMRSCMQSFERIYGQFLLAF